MICVDNVFGFQIGSILRELSLENPKGLINNIDNTRDIKTSHTYFISLNL